MIRIYLYIIVWFVSLYVEIINELYTTFTNFSMEYLVMCEVYTGVGVIK